MEDGWMTDDRFRSRYRRVSEMETTMFRERWRSTLDVHWSNTSNDVALDELLGNKSRQTSPVTAITKMIPLMQVYHLETRSRNKKAPSLSYKMVIHSYSIIWSREVKRTISTKLHRNSNVQIYILSMFRALALTGVLVFKNRQQCEDLQSL